MQTAEKIILDANNSINGIVQHYRISANAENELGVEIKGTLKRPHYKFLDGSSMVVDHILGDYDINYPRSVTT